MRKVLFWLMNSEAKSPIIFPVLQISYHTLLGRLESYEEALGLFEVDVEAGLPQQFGVNVESCE